MNIGVGSCSVCSSVATSTYCGRSRYLLWVFDRCTTFACNSCNGLRNTTVEQRVCLMRWSSVEYRLLLVKLSEILVTMWMMYIFLGSRVSNIIRVADRAWSIATKQFVRNSSIWGSKWTRSRSICRVSLVIRAVSREAIVHAGSTSWWVDVLGLGLMIASRLIVYVKWLTLVHL